MPTSGNLCQYLFRSFNILSSEDVITDIVNVTTGVEDQSEVLNVPGLEPYSCPVTKLSVYESEHFSYSVIPADRSDLKVASKRYSYSIRRLLAWSRPSPR
jgi:hypothetical protein